MVVYFTLFPPFRSIQSWNRQFRSVSDRSGSSCDYYWLYFLSVENIRSNTSFNIQQLTALSFTILAGLKRAVLTNWIKSRNLSKPEPRQSNWRINCMSSGALKLRAILLISDFYGSGIACRLATIEGWPKQRWAYLRVAREMVSECTHYQSSALLTLIFIQVPIIAIFTKMDALDARAFNELILDDVPYAKAKMQAHSRGEEIFKTNFLQRLEEVKHKPRSVARLRGMSLIVGDTSTPLSRLPLRHE